MASALTDAHIVAQQRLRKIVAAAVAQAWGNLPGYDEENVPQFVAAAAPVVEAGQRRSVLLTQAYLARALGRNINLAPTGLTGPAVRNGTGPETEWRRPFVQVWSMLQDGTRWQQAVDAGGERASSMAEMDIQLSSRAAFGAAQEADSGIYGYRRVADSGACTFCLAVNGAYVKSANAHALHNHCGCSLEPLVTPHPRAAFLPDGATVQKDFAVHEHGEVGAMLVAPGDRFTSLADIG